MTSTDSRPSNTGRRKAAGVTLLAVHDTGSSLLALLQHGDPMRREATGGGKVSSRGLKTRAGLLLAAGELFSQHGYQPTSVAMIASEAGTSLGTFYQYFSDRADILTALVAQEVAALLADRARVWHVQDGPAGLVPFLTAYVTATAEKAAFWRVWEEVTHADAGLANVRRDLVRLVNSSVAKQITKGQALGLISGDVAPGVTAAALTAMVDRHIYVTYVFDPPQPVPDVHEVAVVLADIWSRAIFNSSVRKPHLRLT